MKTFKYKVKYLKRTVEMCPSPGVEDATKEKQAQLDKQLPAPGALGSNLYLLPSLRWEASRPDLSFCVLIYRPVGWTWPLMPTLQNRCKSSCYEEMGFWKGHSCEDGRRWGCRSSDWLQGQCLSHSAPENTAHSRKSSATLTENLDVRGSLIWNLANKEEHSKGRCWQPIHMCGNILKAGAISPYTCVGKAKTHKQYLCSQGDVNQLQKT